MDRWIGVQGWTGGEEYKDGHVNPNYTWHSALIVDSQLADNVSQLSARSFSGKLDILGNIKGRASTAGCAKDWDCVLVSKIFRGFLFCQNKQGHGAW